MKIEQLCVECVTDGIDAAFSPAARKAFTLAKLRINIETIKRLLRIEHELQIIGAKPYLNLSQMLCEISKEAAGWIKYLKQKESV